jgi:hypothetical protein
MAMLAWGVDEPLSMQGPPAYSKQGDPGASALSSSRASTVISQESALVSAAHVDWRRRTSGGTSSMQTSNTLWLR